MKLLAPAVALLALIAPFAEFAEAQTAVGTDFGVEHVDLPSRVIVGKASVVRATIRNEGSVDGLGEIDFRYADGTPLAQTGAVGFRFGVPAKSARVVELAFTAPFERRGAAEIVVTVRAPNDPEPANDTARLATFFHAPALNLTFEAPSSTNATPGGATFVRYRLENRGNAVDRPALAATVAAPWLATWATPLPEIPPGGRVTGVLLLRANTSVAREPLDLRLRAISAIDPAVAVDRAAPRLETDRDDPARLRAFTIDRLPSRVQLFENETLDVPFDVANAGAAREIANVTAVLARAAAGWTARVALPTDAAANARVGIPSNASHVLVDLEPGERAALVLRLTRVAGSSAPAPAVTVRAAAVNERLLEPATRAAANVTATLALAPASHDLRVVRVETPSVVYRGDALPVSILVENAGRETAPAVRARMDLRDTLRSLAGETIDVPSLEPGARTTLAWSVPSTADLSGAYSIVATLETGVEDGDRANDAAVVPVHVRNPRLAVHAPASVSAVPGAAIRLESAAGGFAVENRGDRGESVHVTLVSSEPWLAGHWTIDVPAGATRAVPVLLTVPRFPHVAAVEATVSATLANRSAFFAHAKLSFVVNDTLPPVVEALPPDVARPGVLATLRARADDETGVARGEVIVVDPDGGRVALALGRVAGDATLFEVKHRPARAGVHLLIFRFEDATPAARLATLELPWTVANETYGGLRPLDFVDGLETAAASVRFEEAFPGTTRWATVDLGRGPAPLLPPYSVALDGLPEGPVVLAVTAVAASGATWNGTWRLVLDRTAPEIATASVFPAGPGRVRLAAEANESVAVTARFESPAGLSDVALRPAREGRFEAEALAPAGWTRVVFVARDAAGNAATSTVEAAGSPDGDRIPSPLLTAGFALATAALSRRRRT